MRETTYFNTGARWAQSTRVNGGEPQIRVLEIVAPPTLSRPVTCEILRNDLHPHRVGKTIRIRRADLTRKYVLA